MPRRIQLLIVMLLSLALYCFGNTFPLGLHFDESKKVRFILSYEQDFRHPILLLELARFANLFFRYTDEQAVAIVARFSVAFISALIVPGIYKLARYSLRHPASLLTALMVGTCPTIAVHSHYIKEDMLLTVAVIWSMYFFTYFLHSPSVKTAIWFGSAVGLAFSSHYKSLLLLVVFAPFLLYANRYQLGAEDPKAEREDGSISNRILWRLVCLAGLIASVVFSLVNWPIFIRPSEFLRGSNYELQHAVNGHGILIHAFPQWFTYHLRHNIFSGMTIPLTIVSLLGFVMATHRWRRLGLSEQVMIVATMVFYFVPEISPTKPPPDDGRYIIPAVVTLGFFAGWLVEMCWNTRFVFVRSLTVIAVTGVLSFSLYDTGNLVYNLNRDTREKARVWIEDNLKPGETVTWKPLSAPWHIGPMKGIDLLELQEGRFDFVVVSSFHYDRYLNAAASSGQLETVYAQTKAFQELFQKPFVEIRPVYRSFAFSNPTIRIVDLRRGAEKHLP